MVVGVDGSSNALRAARWAATEAVRRKVGLRIVTAFARTADHVVGHPGLGERYRKQMLEVACREIATAAEAAAAAEPDLDVRTQVEVGAPIGVLGSEARRVVGIDGSPVSEGALSFAFDTAAAVLGLQARRPAATDTDRPPGGPVDG